MAGTARNRVGERYGRLTVVRLSERRGSDGQLFWWCRCDCGNEREVMAQRLYTPGSRLKNPATCCLACAKQITGGRSKITDVDKQELFHRYKRGEPLHAICKTLPCGTNHARKLLRAEGIPIRDRKQALATPTPLVDTIIRLYENEGKTADEIAELVPRSVTAVYEILQRNGVHTRGSASPRRTIPAECHQEICKKYREGVNANMLAAEYDSSETTIYKILSKHGVDRRSSLKIDPATDYPTIRRLYEDDKLTSRQIASQFGVHESTVLKVLRQLEIEARSFADYGTLAVSANQKSDILSHYANTRSVSQVCKKVGLSKWVVRRVLRENAIDVRKTKLTVDDERVLVRKFEDGASLNALASEFLISYGSVCNILKRHGKTPPSSRLNTEKWISRAQSKWGDRFDYSRVVIVDSRTKVEIVCPTHGPVWVCPQYHVRDIPGNTGCTKCGSENKNADRRMSFEEFLSLARAKYGDKYRYDADSWPNSVIGTISYVCPLHGRRRQKVCVHLGPRENNQGCSRCGRIHANESTSSDTETFIRSAREIHGDAYDYSESIYRGNKKKVKVICRTQGHKPFYTTPNSHLSSKSGCPECAGTKPLTREVFIHRARLMHGNRYDFDNLIWVNTSTHVTITCPIHGDWDVLPTNFLYPRNGRKGSGCPQCAFMEKGIDSLPYFHTNPDWADSQCDLYVAIVGGLLKPGISTHAEKRDPVHYDEIIFRRTGQRVIAWCVEQRFLLATASAVPLSIPEHLIGWRGRHELRNSDVMPRDEMAAFLRGEWDECEEIGWVNYAEKHFLPIIGFGWKTDFTSDT